MNNNHTANVEAFLDTRLSDKIVSDSKENKYNTCKLICLIIRDIRTKKVNIINNAVSVKLLLVINRKEINSHAILKAIKTKESENLFHDNYITIRRVNTR